MTARALTLPLPGIAAPNGRSPRRTVPDPIPFPSAADPVLPLHGARAQWGGERPEVAGLVRAAQSGDREAFDGLYLHCVARVHALCYRMSDTPEQAEELTQDVFVRAWERLNSFRGDSRFTSWLHRLAVNVVLEARRSAGRFGARMELTGEPDSYAAAAREAPPDVRMDLERAIASLPTGARLALVLHDVQGYKHEEIAELTGTAVGTVKAQLHRARRLVRERLGR